MGPGGDEIKVLHVDDDQSFVTLTPTLLTRESSQFSVTTAASPTEGMTHLHENNVDCVVSDYDMPDTNGIEFLESVRAEFPELPFILFTGKGSEAVASEAISAGVTDYLQKSSSADQYTVLANRIENAVEASRAKQRVGRLERVRKTVREVNRSLVREESREPLEQAVCYQFVTGDAYAFVWLTRYDDGRLTPHAARGIDSAALEPTHVSDTCERTETAVTTPQLVVERDPTLPPEVTGEPDPEYNECAVVPTMYNDTIYGTLHLYTQPETTISGEEELVLIEIADDIGYGIHNLEMKSELAEGGA
ncbi:response regulator [Halovenus salina]|uniref:Response regulator n=1 Tax=Halovenus salina TaxID=1510225 RepID=A0ABD5W054_9EURY|nr:response regulator [Halovenus salina]